MTLGQDLGLVESANCCAPKVSSDSCCSTTDTDCCSESSQGCCTTNSSECCSDSSNSCSQSNDACCSSPIKEPASKNNKNAVITLISFAAFFVVGNYLMPSWVLGQLNTLPERAAESLTFFISHTISLIGILGAVTGLAVFIRSFINEDKVRSHMSKVSSIKGHGIAAGIGVATPFCSCSAVPVFTGFVRSGVPISQAISFLVASPLVNEIAIVMLASWVSWQIAGMYAAAGFLIAILAGLVLKRIATPELTEVSPAKNLLTVVQESGRSRIEISDRLNMAAAEASEIVRSTFLYILIGVGAGSLIHGWVPESAIATIAAFGPVLGVLAATALGVPLYSGIATVIPVVSALAEKGMPLGTLLAFSMSVTALSLPEAMLLRKIMKPKLLAMYFATVASGIVIVGIAFNLMLGS